MRELKNSIKDWLLSMRIEGSVKYRMCEHAYSEDSLDAISLAYDLEHMIGLELDSSDFILRKEMLDKYQTGKEGFFYEHDAKEKFEGSPIDRVLEMHGNYLTFQTIGAYRAIKLLPKRKISFYDKYASDIERYLSVNCPWEKSPWGAGGMVDNLGTILKCNIDMGYDNYKKIMDDVFIWLDKNQDEETGLWKCKNNPQGINGLINGGYHLMRGTYFLYKKSFNRAELIIDTILKDLQGNDIFHGNRAHGCNDLDHFFLLQKCNEVIPNYRKEDIFREAKKRKQIIMSVLNCYDGGFSFWNDKAVQVHNYYDVSPGYKESDMQGTVFYLQTLISINSILGENNEFQTSLSHG